MKNQWFQSRFIVAKNQSIKAAKKFKNWVASIDEIKYHMVPRTMSVACRKLALFCIVLKPTYWEEEEK